MRVPAGDIEALVLDRLRAFFSSRTDIGDALTPLELEALAFDAALRNAFTLSKRWLAMAPIEMKSLILDIVERATITTDRIEIRLSRAKIAAALEPPTPAHCRPCPTLLTMKTTNVTKLANSMSLACRHYLCSIPLSSRTT
jgi:hypothetical protein